MTVKKLKEKLKNIPDKAEVLTFDTEGDRCETYDITVSRSKIGNNLNDMIFEWDNWKRHYKDKDIDEYDENGEITAILI